MLSTGSLKVYFIKKSSVGHILSCHGHLKIATLQSPNHYATFLSKGAKIAEIIVIILYQKNTSHKNYLY